MIAQATAKTVDALETLAKHHEELATRQFLVESLADSDAFKALMKILADEARKWQGELLDGTGETPPYRQGQARGALGVIKLVEMLVFTEKAGAHKERALQARSRIASILGDTGITPADLKEFIE